MPKTEKNKWEKCEKCGSDQIKKIGYVYKEPISQNPNKTIKGKVYSEYECETCGDRFKIEQSRKVIGRQRLINDLSILLIENL